MPVDKIYKAVTNDEGAVVYVDVTPDDIPDELIRGTKVHKETVAESIKRRNRAQKAEEMLQTLAKSDSNDEVPEVPAADKPVVTPAPVLDKAALYAEFKQQLIAETGVETVEQKQARIARQEEINKLLKDNGLSESVRLALETSTNPAETAKVLAQSGYRFDRVEGGEIPRTSTGAYDDIISRLNEKFQGKK
jgi:cell division protein FtsX